MDLLDLPPELFQKITHDLVDFAGVWKLRAIYRIFASEIEYQVLTKRPVAAFDSHYDRRFLEKCADRYLVSRLQLPLDVNKNLLDKIQKLIDWTTHELDIKGEDQQKMITQKICTALKENVGGWSLVYGLQHTNNDNWASWHDWVGAELDGQDQAIVALATGSYELLLRIFPTIEKCQGRPWFNFSPFEAALIGADKMLLASIFQYLKSLPLQDPSAPMDRRRHVQASQEEFSFDTASAVNVAMRHNNVEGLQSLLDFYQDHLPRPDKGTFDCWFQVATGGLGYYANGAGNREDHLRRLMDFKPGGKTMLVRQHFNVICDLGSAAMIHDALTRLGNDLDKGGILTLPIFVAVRSARAVAVKAVLDAGADPNITAPSNIRSLNKDRLTPVDVAIHKHSIPVIDVLVKRGNVTLPHISEWPTHHRTYNHLRNIVNKNTGAKLPELRSFSAWATVSVRLSSTECADS